MPELTANQNLVHLRDLEFAWSGSSTPLIECVEFQLNRGEHLFIRGSSGSGKSTLLNLIAAVLLPQRGQLSLLGRDVVGLSASQRDHLRANHVGFIFQQFNLVPYLNLIENVLLPCRFSRLREARAADRFGHVNQAARYLLEQLFVDDNLDMNSPVSQLSVGQQQRVAAARALIGSPDILIADEPTSSLDSAARLRFMDLLFEQAEAFQSTLLFVSHDESLSTRFDRIVEIETFKAESIC